MEKNLSLNFLVHSLLANNLGRLPIFNKIDWWGIRNWYGEKLANIGISLIYFGNPFKDRCLAARLRNVALDYDPYP